MDQSMAFLKMKKISFIVNMKCICDVNITLVKTIYFIILVYLMK